MQTFTRHGLEFFGHRMGLPLRETLQQWKLSWHRYESFFEQVGQSLIHPPNADLQSADAQYSRPWVDDAIIAFAKKMGIQAPHPWPFQAPYAVCLTHDIDRIFCTVQGLKENRKGLKQRLSSLTRNIASTHINSLRDTNPFFNFRDIIKLENEWDVPSASYVLFEKRRWMRALKQRAPQHVLGVYSPSQISKQLKEYQAVGNEVGIHASFDAWKDPKALNHERERLEALGIRAVRGIRNHYLLHDAQVTPHVQTQCGFSYDSTMGFNFLNGFRTGTCFPYRLRSIWELPMQLMDSASRFRTSSLKHRKLEALALLSEVRRVGGIMMINWHFRVMNQTHRPEEIELLDSVIKAAKTDGAWFARPIDVMHQWESRLEKQYPTRQPATPELQL